MRTFVSIGLMIILALGAESGVFAAAQSSGSVTGTALGSNMQPLPNVRVQLRNTQTGEAVATTMANEAGSFSFAGVQPGDYIAEVVDASDKVLGIGTPFSVAAGQSASTSVLALGGTAVRSSGFSLFGLGPVTSMTVLGAAAAASVTAVVTTRADASPSR